MTFEEWWKLHGECFTATRDAAQGLWKWGQEEQRKETAERAREMAVEWCHVAPDEYPVDLNTALDFAETLAQELDPPPEGAKPRRVLPLPWTKRFREELAVAAELKGILWARHCLAINADKTVSARILKLQALIRKPVARQKRQRKPSRRAG